MLYAARVTIKFQPNMLNEFLNTVKYIPRKPRLETTDRIWIVYEKFLLGKRPPKEMKKSLIISVILIGACCLVKVESQCQGNTILHLRIIM